MDDQHRDWLGFPSRFLRPSVQAGVPRSAKPVRPLLGRFMSGDGDQVAREATDVALWHDGKALCLRARCHAAAMHRVRDLVARRPTYGRDTWGDDALEVQIDVGLTRREYRHFILPPTGVAVTYRGFNNRQQQGWHPTFGFQAGVEDDGWTVEATFPFVALGRAPAEGETWGLNVIRTNPSEPGGYVQWAPTFGDALRPELFGTITFIGDSEPTVLAEQHAAQIAQYADHAAERRSYFLSAINGIDSDEALEALQVPDWAAWSEYLAQREAPLPLRWDGLRPGADGIPLTDRPIVLEAAESLVQQIERWSLEPPEPAAFRVEGLEALGDAFVLNGEGRYVVAFERAVQVYDRVMQQKSATAAVATGRPGAGSAYHDYQIVRAAMLAHVYLSMRPAELSHQTHVTVMQTMLRAGRFAASNISTAYNYGNHQVYESSGLAIVALLFPELSESEEWARIASRSIRLHLEREVYSDGGYRERCGYHSVAMDFVMQAAAAIRANGAESRFVDLMDPQTLGALERMHEWVLHMVAPDGSLPTFGDYGAHSQVRFLQRGAALFSRSDLAWPVRRTAPDLLSSGLEPQKPASQSVSMPDSSFTVMRDGWERDSWFMAVDHGPLGGQHGHVDAMGFVAYAYGQPIALDSGIGLSYSDPLYRTWYRTARAHNVVVVDEVEPEKVVERTRWRAGEHAEVLEMQSRGLEHALGTVHDRRIVFVKGIGWLIHDRLHRAAPDSPQGHQFDWLLHTPLALRPTAPGVLEGSSSNGGLLVLAARPEELEAPRFEQRSASVFPPEVAAMRQIDAIRRIGDSLVRDITCLTWRKKADAWPVEFVVFLLPYRDSRPDAAFIPSDSGYTLCLGDGRALALDGEDIALIERGRTVWRER